MGFSSVPQNISTYRLPDGVARTTINSRDMIDGIMTILAKGLEGQIDKIVYRPNYLVILMPDGVRFKVMVEDLPPVNPNTHERLIDTLRAYRNYLYGVTPPEGIDAAVAELEQALAESDIQEIEGR